MALSEREKEVLRDLEAQLGSTDPDLAASMSDAMDERSELGWRPSPRHIGMGVFAVIVAFTGMIACVAFFHSVWSVLGALICFGLAVWGVVIALTNANTLSKGGTKAAKAKKSSFMARQEERWDKRNS
jgi:hypothetical protein avisC_00412